MKRRFIQIITLVKQNPYTAFLMAIAAVLLLVVILPSGSHYCFSGACGDYYWGVQEHDGIWHIAVAETAFRNGFNLLNPSFSGATLSGYNILLDFVIHSLSLLGLSSFTVYFKIFPLLWFILFSYTSVRFIRLFSKDKIALFVFLLLSYFGTSFGFLFTLLKGKGIEGVNALTVMQPVLTLTNIQLAFSYITLMWIVIIMLETKKSILKIAYTSILIFLSWGLKFYIGSLVSVIIGIYYCIKAFQTKKYTNVLLLLLYIVLSLVSIVLIYNPFSNIKSTGSAFSYQPLALIWPYVEASDSIFYSHYWANARYFYMELHKLSPRFILFQVGIIALYLISNFGMRIFGLAYVFKNKIKTIDYSIFIAILFGICASLTLIQKGVWWNVVQFLYVSSFLLNIYAAVYIAQIKKVYIRNIFIILVIITAIPYIINSLAPYVAKGSNYVSDAEKKALFFLKNSKKGVVYAPLFNLKGIRNANNINDLRITNDNSYLSAYTGQQTYLQLTGAILLSNDYKKRESNIKRGDCKIVNEIDYVYFHKNAVDLFIKKCIIQNTSFTKIYSSDGYSIYSKLK